MRNQLSKRKTSVLPRLLFQIAGACLCIAAGTRAKAQDRKSSLPPIRHVFVIVLENQGYDTTFRRDSSYAPYLTDTLAKAGAHLTQYFGIGHFSLDNYVAMISGIAPTR